MQKAYETDQAQTPDPKNNKFFVDGKLQRNPDGTLKLSPRK